MPRVFYGICGSPRIHPVATNIWLGARRWRVRLTKFCRYGLPRARVGLVGIGVAVGLLLSSIQPGPSYAQTGNPPLVPTVTDVAITSTAGNDRFYQAGQTVEVTVTFSTDVVVTVGTGSGPQLQLQIGTAEPWATYNRLETFNANDNQVVFTYTVVGDNPATPTQDEGDSAPDGIAIPANAIRLPDGARIYRAGGTEDANVNFAAIPPKREHKVDTAIRAAPRFELIRFDNGPTLTIEFELGEHSTRPGAHVGIVPVQGNAKFRQFLSFRIISGNSAGKFTIADSGALTYVGTGENFERLQPRNRSFDLVIEVANTTANVSTTVTVNIGDDDDPPIIRLVYAGAAPRVGRPIRVALSDEDGTPTEVDWFWRYADDTLVPGGLTGRYTPRTSDVGKRLRAVAWYREGSGGGRRFASTELTPVVLASDGSNQVPEFPAAGPPNVVPGTDFYGDDETEYANYQTVLLEGQAGNVTPIELLTVRATDIDPADTLTYRIIEGNDNRHYRLDANTGMLSYVGPGEVHDPVDLNFTLEDYRQLTVEANDGTDRASAVVLILIQNVNDPGTITLEYEDYRTHRHELMDAPAIGDNLRAVLHEPDIVHQRSNRQWYWEISPNSFPREWTIRRAELHRRFGTGHNWDGPFTPTADVFSDSDQQPPSNRGMLGHLLRVRVLYYDVLGWRDGQLQEDQLREAVSREYGPILDPSHCHGAVPTCWISVGSGRPENLSGPETLSVSLSTDTAEVLGGPFTTTFQFTAPVTEFTIDHIRTSNATVSNFLPDGSDGSRYTALITPTAVGRVAVWIPANVFTQGGRRNRPSDTLTVQYAGPTVRISGPMGPVNGPFAITLTASQVITDLTVADLTVGNGTVDASTWQERVTGREFSVTVTPTNDGPVTVDVSGAAAQTAGGVDSVAAETFNVEADLTSPSVRIDGPSMVRHRLEFAVHFSEPVYGFTPSDISFPTGTSLERFVVTTVNQSYSFVVTLPAIVATEITLILPAGAVTDAAQRGNAVTEHSIVVDQTSPTVIIGPVPDEVNGPFELDIAFNEVVTGFSLEDLDIVGGEVFDLTASGENFVAFIVPDPNISTVTVSVPTDRVADLAGNGNVASAPYSITVNLTVSTVSLKSTQYTVQETADAAELTASANVTLVLSALAVETLRIPLAVTYSGGAVAADFYPLNANATVNDTVDDHVIEVIVVAGQRSISFDVSAVVDDYWEVGEAVVFTLDTATAAWPTDWEVGTREQATVRVTDSLDPPQVTLSASVTQLAEAGGVSTTTISYALDHNGNRGQFERSPTLNLVVTGDVDDQDYMLGNASVQLPTGDGAVTVTTTLSVTADEETEPQESLRISGVVVDAAGNTLMPVVPVNGIEVTIVDAVTAAIAVEPYSCDVRQPDCNLTSEDSYPEPTTETPRTVTYIVSLSASPSEELTLSLTPSGSGTHPATAPVDFTFTTPTVTFAANTQTLTQEVTATILPDNVFEPEEQFVISLAQGASFPSGAVVDTSPVTVTIVDGDFLQVTLWAPTTPIKRTETGTFRVTILESVALSVSIAWAVTLEGEVTTMDFVGATSGMVTFPVGAPAQSEQTFQLTTADDGSTGDQDFAILLSEPTGELTERLRLQYRDLPTTIADFPSVTMISAEGSEVHSQFDVAVTFSEVVTGFTQSDVQVTGGSTVALTESTDAPGQEWIVRIDPDTTGTVTVTMPADVVFDADGHGNGMAELAVTVLDSPAITFAEPNYTVAEQATTGTVVSIMLTNVPAEGNPIAIPVRFDFTGNAVAADIEPGTTTNVSASAGAESNVYVFSTATNSLTFQIKAVDDSFWDPGESFTLTLDERSFEWPEDYAAGATASTVVSIGESKLPPRIVLSAATTALAEQGGARATEIRATVDTTGTRGQLAATYWLHLTFAGATINDDFNVSSSTIAIPGQGVEPATGITLTVTADSISEPGSESIAVTGSLRDRGRDDIPEVVVSGVNLSVVDALTIAVAVNASSATEIAESDSVRSVKYDVILTATPAAPLPITLSADGGTATAGSDFSALEVPTLTVPAGTTLLTYPVTITVTDDTVVEMAETIVLTVADPDELLPVGVVLDPTAATVTITDSDTTQVALNMVGSTTVVEGNIANFTVAAEHEISPEVDVTWMVAAGTTGTAVDLTADLMPTIGTVTLPVNSAPSATAWFSFDAERDTLTEVGETFVVSISIPNASSLNGRITVAPTDSSVAGTVIDPQLTTTIARPVGEDGAVANTFSLDITFAENVTGFETTDLQVTGGRVLTLLPGSTAAAYSVRIRPTVDGTVVVTIPAAVATDSAGSGENQPATFVLTAALPHAVSFTSAATAVTEGAATRVTVALTPVPESGSAVDGVPVSMTLLGGATAADFLDVVQGSENVTAVSGQTDLVLVDSSDGAGSIIVGARDDEFWETGEGLRLALDDAHAEWPDGVRLDTNPFSSRTATVTVTDSKLPPQIVLQATALALAESGGASMSTISVAVKDTGAHGEFQSPHRLEFSFAGSATGPTAAIGGNNQDYGVSAAHIAIPAGGSDPSDTVTFLVRADGITEPSVEQAVLSSQVLDASNQPVGEIMVQPLQFTIVDQLVVSVAAVTKTLAEPVAGTNVTASYEISLSATPTVPIIVIPDASNSSSTAVLGQDFILSDPAEGLEFAAGAKVLTQTLSVSVQADDVVEGTETIAIALTQGADFPSAAAIDPTPALVQVTDDDSLEVSIAAQEPIVGESFDVVFRVQLSKATDVSVTVPWQVTLTAEVDGDDFDAGQALSGNVVFTPGDQPSETREITLSSRDDGDNDEVTETVTVVLSEPTGALGTRATLSPTKARASTTLADLPAPPAGVTVANGWQELQINWVAAAPGRGLPLTGYRIERAPFETEMDWVLVAETGVADTTYRHTGLDTEQTITYRMFAVNSLGMYSTAITVRGRTLPTPEPGSMDVTGDFAVTVDDALVMYYVLTQPINLGVGVTHPTIQHRTRRQLYLTPHLGGSVAGSDDATHQSIEVTQELLSVESNAGLDINLSGAVDAADAALMYYALAFPELVGDGIDPNTGFANFRRAVMQSLLGRGISLNDRNLTRVIRWVHDLQP